MSGTLCAKGCGQPHPQTPATPAVRQRAKDLGVNLSEVRPSEEGRIRHADLDAFLSYGGPTGHAPAGKTRAVVAVAVKGELGEAKVTANELLQAALRLRPDRIVLGELRGAESVSFLRAINTGHPGSFSTIHANSLRGALEQLALMVMQTGIGLTRSDTIAYAAGVIDVRSLEIEAPEQVAERIRKVLRVVPAERVTLTTDCGMKQLPRVCAFQKLRALAAGAEIVRRELGAAS